MRNVRTPLFFLLLFFLPVSIAHVQTARPPAATNGILDLSAWDGGENGTVMLNGEWEFYWDELLGPSDFAGRASLTNRHIVAVPLLWTDYSLDGKKLPIYGYATYRLRLVLPGTNGIYALHIPEMSSSYRLWVDGNFLAGGGTVGTNRALSAMSFAMQTAAFRPVSNRVDIILQIANFKDMLCGFGKSMTLGTLNSIILGRTSRIAVESVIFGILAIMFIYHLMLYLSRRRDLSPLYFGLFCLLFAVKTLFEGEKFLFDLFPGFDMEIYLRAWLISFYLSPPMLYSYFSIIFPQEFLKVESRIIWGISLVFTLVALTLPVEIVTYSVPGYDIVVGIFFVAAVVKAVVAAVRKRDGAVPVLIAFLIFIITGVNDILHSRFIISTAYIAPYGFVFFVFVQAYLIALRFSKAFVTVETLSRDLEQKVEERTRELQKERNALAKKNEIVQGELAIARNIQAQFIPKSSPSPLIAYFYRPMQQVGGDFFDFIQFRQSNKIGIFISDVSGHGVPAAFLTSMLKSTILQSRTFIEDPSQLLFHLNEVMLGQTNHNFITAFYGIYDDKKAEMVYSNAGHNRPFLIRNGRVETLPVKGRGRPLAVSPNEENIAIGNGYVTESITLEKGGKVLFYTDGLTETISLRERKGLACEDDDFESKWLLANLEKLYDKPPDILLSELFRMLVEFRGGGEFDDDVCMICLEV